MNSFRLEAGLDDEPEMEEWMMTSFDSKENFQDSPMVPEEWMKKF